ncbi:hypothetical protein H8S90_12830 [Olivibacter sp. SDN3]|uniref:hypothetical protein n=1 Tax=Olivibacter sp. SDN3 TaxID=2764720 RepID=UPI00165142D3|nr:hypothetical protein [Olivibacter sp. SDN3]QNL47711.1 hypothetical protein H8S90_12830 [Olivibacter sp. SDN3]
MKDKENRELITRMAEALREHSAPYREGAWERFAKKGKGANRLMPLWYLSGAAAILLLGVTFFLYNKSGVDEVLRELPHQVVSKTPLEENTQTDEEKPDYDTQNLAVSESNKNKIVKSSREEERATLKTKANPLGEVSLISVINENDVIEKRENHIGDQSLFALQVPNVRERQASSISETTGKVQEKPNANDMVENEDPLIKMLSEGEAYSRPELKMVNEEESSVLAKRWGVGVVFAPSLTEERVNMGGGVTVAYRLSNKISIGSGVSIVDLGFQQGGSQTLPPASSPSAVSSDNSQVFFTARNAETRELTSINTNVLALDVPIDLKYHINNRFYASAGVSLFAILNENRVNNYNVTRVATNRTMENMESLAVAQPEFEVMSISEQSTETPLQGNSYSGFLNFSVGHQLPLSKKVGLSVEPFYKLPVGTLSRQNINFRYGGLRVITSF